MERLSREEKLNVLTHGAGTVLSVVATVLMLVRVSGSTNRELQFACVVYGFALIGVFASSTMSHVMQGPVWHSRFRQLDQAFIYLLIVATYTPCSVVYLRTTFWWILLGAMWLVAVVRISVETACGSSNLFGINFGLCRIGVDAGVRWYEGFRVGTAGCCLGHFCRWSSVYDRDAVSDF